MKRKFYGKKSAFVFWVSVIFLTGGCSSIIESGKTLWGSSTRALENAKADGEARSYYCANEACFDAILSLGRNEELYEPETQKFFDVFIKDRIQNHIVVMGISGNINTTEVGIFLDSVSETAIRITISSLSSTAKMRVAQAVFDELDQRFNRASSYE